MSDFPPTSSSDRPEIDEQAQAEQLDDDKVRGLDQPTDVSMGVDGFGTTPVEESGGESVEQRDQREDHRIDLRDPSPPTAGLLEPDDEFGPDLTKEAVAVEGDEPDSLTAEEAAVHERRPRSDDGFEEPLEDLVEPRDQVRAGHRGLDDASISDELG